MKFNVSQSGSKFSFVLTDDSNKFLAQSESFDSQELCISAIRALIPQLLNSNAFSVAGNKFSISAEGAIVATSNEFASNAAATTAFNAIIEDATDEAQYEVVVETQIESTQSRFVELPTFAEIDYTSLYDFSKSSSSNNEGIDPFDEDGRNYSFYFNGINGKTVLYSRQFDSAGRRDKRIRQVINASKKDERFEIIESDGSFYFIIKARNQAEIGRSINYTSRAMAEADIAYCKENIPKLAKQYPEPAKKKRKSNVYNFDIKSETNEAGFHTVRGDNKEHYFILNDEKGASLLYSQGYTSGSSRDNGIKTVIKNSNLSDQHIVKEENGKFYFVLRSSNRQEIARSIDFDTKEGAETKLAWSLENIQQYAGKYGVVIETTKIETETNSFVIDVDLPKEETIMEENANNRNEDEYLDCEAYLNHEESPAEGFRIFQADGEHYFVMVNPAGEVLLRSEGYPTTGARDNGLASVQKNREISERYSIVEDEGEYFVSLKAGNHKEIARSCGFKSEADANGVFGFINGSGGFPWILPIAESVSNRNEDEYLDCEAYLNHEESPAEGFRIFQADGEHYFVMVSPSGEVLLRSEGYPTTGARDNGLASVQKNREISERYSIVEDEGEYFVSLKAGNHKEIARSCGFKSEADANGAFGFINGSGGFPWALPLAAIAAEVVTKSEEDNYLACKEYENHEESPVKGFHTFTKEDSGEHYFAMYDEMSGKTLLRSEGYPSKGARDNGLQSVLKNRDIQDRYSTIETDSGHHFVILKAANHKEIARSCGFKDKAALLALFPFLGSSYSGKFPWEIVGLTGAAAAITSVAIPETVEEKPIGVEAAAIAPAAAIGVASAVAAKKEIPQVVAQTVAESEIAAGGGGIPRWLWALLAALLLGLLLWWLLRGCDGKSKEVPIITEAAPPPTVMVDTVEVEPPAIVEETPPVVEEVKTSEEPIAAIGGTDCGCDTGKEPLFMSYAYKPKTLTKLGSNTEFGNSHSLTPSQFYDKLSNAYNTNETDRVFLDRIFKSMGYKDGWSAAKPSMFSNTIVPYGTVGNIGYGKDHRTQYSTLNLGENDQKAFLIKSRNGCDVRFMKTCGNHMFYCTK